MDNFNKLIINNLPYWYVLLKININFLKFNTYQQLRKEKKMTGGRYKKGVRQERELLK